MPTQLEILAEQYRREHLTKNAYVDKNEYSSNHPNAMSDGDEKGKGDVNGKVGSLSDINARTANMTKNVYNEENKYSSINLNEHFIKLISVGNKRMVSDLIWIQTLLESDLETEGFLRFLFSRQFILIHGISRVEHPWYP